MATSGTQRKLAVEASRGALIAVHAAAGLAREHAQALRLLRAAEGLCRTAVAVLLADDSLKKEPAGANADSAKDKGKGKGKNEEGMKDVDKAPPPGQSRRRRRARPRGAAAVDFDDSWADAAVAPPALAAPPAAHAPPPPPPPPPVVARAARSLSQGEDDEDPQPALKQARGPPPTRAAPPRSLELEESECFLLEGHVACVRGLVSRPDLAGAPVTLVGFDSVAERWICKTQADEQLRIIPGNLTPVEELIYPFWKARVPG